MKRVLAEMLSVAMSLSKVIGANQCGCKKPVERLWISSMEDSAIQEGFQKRRPGTEYDALAEFSELEFPPD